MGTGPLLQRLQTFDRHVISVGDHLPARVVGVVKREEGPTGERDRGAPRWGLRDFRVFETRAIGSEQFDIAGGIAACGAEQDEHQQFLHSAQSIALTEGTQR